MIDNTQSEIPLAVSSLSSLSSKTLDVRGSNPIPSATIDSNLLLRSFGSSTELFDQCFMCFSIELAFLNGNSDSRFQLLINIPLTLDDNETWVYVSLNLFSHSV